MRRRTVSLLLLALLGGLLLSRVPLGGKVWSPAQIHAAVMDGSPVPAARYAQLYWDAQRSRLGGVPSKCAGFVTITLSSGATVQLRLSSNLAAQHWPTSCL